MDRRKDDDARLLIMKRRAAFVASALAATACGGPREPSAVTVPILAASERPAPPVVASAPPPEPPAPPKAPPLDYSLPPDVSNAVRQRFESLFVWSKEMFAIAEDIEANMPGSCKLSDPTCRQAWRAVAEKLWRIDRGFPSRCPGTSSGAKLWEKRAAEHRAGVAERRALCERNARAALARDGGGSDDEWRALVGEVSASHPMPCLSIRCTDW